ncbi:MAG: peptidoglycan-binding domain-containing protein [Thainema sp.]
MIRRILQSRFASLGAASMLAVAPILFHGLSAQAQVANIDGRFEEYQAGITPTLTYGITSPTVQDLQIFMDELGYYNSPIDGNYGNEVVNAVEEFQTDYGLLSDGIVGANTWDSILGIDPDSVFEAEDSFDSATGEYSDYEDDYAYNEDGAFTDEAGIFEESELSPENEGVF